MISGCRPATAAAVAPPPENFSGGIFPASSNIPPRRWIYPIPMGTRLHAPPTAILPPPPPPSRQPPPATSSPHTIIIIIITSPSPPKPTTPTPPPPPSHSPHHHHVTTATTAASSHHHPQPAPRVRVGSQPYHKDVYGLGCSLSRTQGVFVWGFAKKKVG
ncbi:hypothetical protein Tco_0375113 [Tanacetum coccineum]